VGTAREPPGTWADTAENCLALLQAVDHPAFGYIWDVCNLYEAEPVHLRPGYEKLEESIAEHIRIVAALRHGDGEAASAEMRPHITRTAASADIILD
jgi:DNA-binding FadR family transcriptional regulator